LRDQPHSAGSALRKVVAAVILVPLTALIIGFAVANRQDVTISLDPFGSNVPAAWQTQRLFVVIIAVLILGVIVGAAPDQMAADRAPARARSGKPAG
jgi:hypothetical protein